MRHQRQSVVEGETRVARLQSSNVSKKGWLAKNSPAPGIKLNGVLRIYPKGLSNLFESFLLDSKDNIKNWTYYYKLFIRSN